MPFSDDNTLEDILGAIFVLQCDLSDNQPEALVVEQFNQLLDRINLKIAKNRNKIRGNWFNLAKEHASNALNLYQEGKSSESDKTLLKVRDYLEQGNKAHKRKATFIVSPDGTIYHKAEQGAAANP